MNAQRLMRMSCVLAILAVGALAHADAPITKDGFNYPAGNIDPNAGGAGWANAWSSTGNFPNQVAYPGLTDPPLPSNGGCLQIGYGGQGSWRNIKTSLYPASMLTATGDIGANGSDLWISFLVQRVYETPQDYTYDAGGLYLFGNNGTTESLLIGEVPNTDQWGISSSTGQAVAPALINTGQTYLLVSHITFGGSSSGGGNADFYVNPIVGPAAPGAPAATYTGPVLPFATVEFFADAYTLPYNVDELRIGTSYLAVTAAALPGDANRDGTVDINDLTIVLTNYGKTGQVWSQGDMDGDPTGTVDINDLTIVLTNYGTTYGAGIKAVPEPVSLVLLGIAAIAFLLFRRERRAP